MTFSCTFLANRRKVIENSLVNLQKFIDEDILRATEMNKTASDCSTLSTQVVTRSERTKWTMMAENYFKLSKNYLNQSQETQKFLASLQSDLVDLEIKLENQNCPVEVTTTASTLTTASSTLKAAMTTLSSSGLPAGLSLSGPADFGYIMQIVIEVLEEVFNESFGGLSYQQIFSSIFTGMDCYNYFGNFEN